MELKQLIKQFSYKIEPKPEGGFIARSSDPSVPPLEAPTREELATKIQANFAAALGLSFPMLKIPVDQQNVKLQVHIDRKPEGGYSVHSEEVGAGNLDPATHEKIDHMAEQLLGFVDKNFPQLSEKLAAQAGSNNIQVTTRTTGTSAAAGAKLTDLATTMLATPRFQKMFAQPDGPKTMASGTPDLMQAGLANTPITPEATSLKTFFRLLLFVVMVGVAMYFVFYRH